VLAIEAVQVAAVAFAFTLALLTGRLLAGRRGAGALPWLSLAPVFALALAASRMRFVPRPHLATFAGLSLLLWLWERRPRRLPLWFGLLGIVWGNCHAGTVFGVVVMAAILGDAALRRDVPRLRSAALCTAAFLVGTLANPYGLYQYQYSFGHLSVGKIVPLYEFKHASPAANPLFFLYAALVAAAVPLRLRRRDFLFPLLALPFFALAVDAVRVIPKFILVTLPGLVLTAAELRAALGARARVAGAAAVLALAAAAAGLAAREWRGADLLGPFGWGLDARFLPEGAARFVERRDLQGRMFNDFDQGGYFIWRLFPGRKVFQDGRVQAYPPAFFRELMGSHGAGSWPAMIDHYGIDYALVKRRPFSGDLDAGALFEAMGWPLVFLDGNSYVYVQPGSANDARTAADRLRLVRAGDSSEQLYAKGKRDPAAMRAELRRIDPRSLHAPGDFDRFGTAAHGAGDAGLSEAFFAEGVARHPGDLVIRMNLASLLLSEGRRDEARNHFARVAESGRGTALAAKAEEWLRRLPTAR
jgi:hypothetical protein